jgi:hypothetical protein
MDAVGVAVIMLLGTAMDDTTADGEADEDTSWGKQKSKLRNVCSRLGWLSPSRVSRAKMSCKEDLSPASSLSCVEAPAGTTVITRTPLRESAWLASKIS